MPKGAPWQNRENKKKKTKKPKNPVICIKLLNPKQWLGQVYPPQPRSS